MIKQIVKLAIPVILGQIAHIILSFADRYFIAKLGIEQAAGASLSVSLVWFLISLSTVISGGTVALVSRKFGENNKNETTESAEQSIFLAITLGIVFTYLCYSLSGITFAFFNAQPLVEKLGLSYFRILLLGFPFIIAGQVVSAIFQASGNTKTPMKIFTGMCIMNLILDPFFIFKAFSVFGFELSGFGLGMKGAAYATLLSQSSAIIWLFFEIYRFDKIEITIFWKVYPKIHMIKRILRIGSWTGLNSFSRPVTVVVMQRIIAYHGTDALAAFSFGLQWISFIFLFFEGLRVAMATIVGQNLGKKSIDKARNAVSSGLFVGYMIISVFIICGLLFADSAIGMFTDKQDLIDIGASYLNIVLIGMIFSVPMTVYTAAFNGAGDTMPPMVIAFIANWVGKVGISYIATFYLEMSIQSVWFAIALSIVIEGIGVYLWFKTGKWQSKVI